MGPEDVHLSAVTKAAAASGVQQRRRRRPIITRTTIYECTSFSVRSIGMIEDMRVLIRSQFSCIKGPVLVTDRGKDFPLISWPDLAGNAGRGLPPAPGRRHPATRPPGDDGV
jgi:hypothetical protein